MDEMTQAAQSIAKFLQVFTTNGGLRLRFRVKVRSMKATAPGMEEPQSPDEPRNLYVEFSGPDTPILLARNGEVLNALEHIATKILRLEAEEHDRVSFDADHFKANRDRQMQEWAAAAIERVQLTGRPHSFPAMSSRERRALHLLLSKSGLPTASSGEGPGRFVVLYPEGADTSAPTVTRDTPRPYDVNAVRKAFRPR
jgi:spoIIIJ-associated protein